MLPTDIHQAYLAVPDKERGIKFHPAGRFLVHRGQLHILENYHGLLDHIPEGPIDELTLKQLQDAPANLRTASNSSIRSGYHPEYIPEAKLDVLPKVVDKSTMSIADQAAVSPRPPSIWNYQRVGHDSAHTLEHHGNGRYTLDGNPLRDDELHTILGNIQNKAATLRYKHSGVVDAVMKMERSFYELRKAEEDPDPEEALLRLEKLHEKDPETLNDIRSVRRTMFEDPMNPGLGNKLAYEKYRRRAPEGGVWASLDLNDLRALNNTYGHDVGDELIRQSGKALRESVDPGTAKSFRAGGDEYVVHFPSYEHAAQAMRTLRDKMDQITPIQGQYKPSFSAGLGTDFKSADKALLQAKERKHTTDPATGVISRAYPIGQVPHLVHSNVPGYEGPVPIQQEHLPHIPPPEAPTQSAIPAHSGSATPTAHV